MPKVLLADASPMIHRIVDLALAQEGMQVVTARDGEQAIALIPAERPDIVLADHALTGRSGYDVAAFVKGNLEWAHIPVLLLSGAFEPVDKVRATQVGCDGTLTKPFDPRQLIARIRELLGAARPGARVHVCGPPDSDEVGDDPFSALHAALGQLGESRDGARGRRHAPEGERARAGTPDESSVPTVDSLLGDLSTGKHPSAVAGAVSPAARSSDMDAEMSAQDRHGSGPESEEPAPLASEALIEEVTRRVLERLAPNAVDPAVSRIVTAVAERLLREELERIRAGRG